MILSYCDHEPLPLPAGHKFPIQKYRQLRDTLAAEPRFQFEPAELAAVEDVERAHDSAYVRGVLTGTLPEAAFRRIGFPWSPQMVRRTLCSAGGTLAATERALRCGFGGTLAGGTHHAGYAEGSGFCVFNDFAIAIRKHGFHRAAVIDLDVHQGDGTAAIFENDPSVFTLSLHGANNFPFRKKHSRLDVPLLDDTSDQEFLQALSSALPEVWRFNPQIVFFQAGVDVLATDTLGRLALSPEGVRARDRAVFEACFRQRIPVVTVLGGGYSEPLDRTVEAHASTFLLALRIFENPADYQKLTLRPSETA